MPAANATYKVGIEFCGWSERPASIDIFTISRAISTFQRTQNPSVCPGAAHRARCAGTSPTAGKLRAPLRPSTLWRWTAFWAPVC